MNRYNPAMHAQIMFSTCSNNFSHFSGLND